MYPNRGRRGKAGWSSGPIAGMLPAVRSAALATLLVVWPASSVGSQPAKRTDPLVRVAGADPLEVAAVVHRQGDGPVLARLAGERPVAVRLAAVRAARWLRAPEQALARLAEMASGRDPDLAPAAARAAWRIARALDGSALDRREVQRDELAPALRTLRALAADDTARADVRRAAGHAAGALGALGVER